MTNLLEIAIDQISTGYNLVEYLGFSLIVKMDNGYVNATHLCKQSDKKKTLSGWKRQESSNEVLNDLSFDTGIDIQDLTQVIAGGQNIEIRGTYVHPYLVPVIAQWCSSKFRIRVAIMLEEMAVREYKCKLAESAKENFDLKHMIKQQSNKIDELLGYAKDTKAVAERTEAKLDVVVDAASKVIDNLDTIHYKVDDIVELVTEQRVIPPSAQSKLQSLVLVKTDVDKIQCVRRQNGSMQKTISHLIRDNPNAKVVDEFPCPNSVSFFVRFREYLRKNKKTPVKVKYQTITGNLEDVKRVVAILRDEQCKIDALDDIKIITTNGKTTLVSATEN